MRAWGTSMLPSVWPGDVLTIVGATSTEIAPGDIVLVLGRDCIFVHRLLGRHKDASLQAWITKGDAMPRNDPPASDSALLGRVVSIRRGVRDLTPHRQVSRLQSLIALLACRSGRFRSTLLRLQGGRSKSLSGGQNVAPPFRTMTLNSDDCNGWPSCP
jgi:hypothetical protein